MAKKYLLPEFLEGRIKPDEYRKWLQRKAQAHVRRDRKRGNNMATYAEYKSAIHKAVTAGGEYDSQTGEPLNWSLISKYDNKRSKAGGRKYKKSFALLPTVDHVGDGLGPAAFEICSWRTNDCKSDLTEQELIEFCKKVLKHKGYKIRDSQGGDNDVV